MNNGINDFPISPTEPDTLEDTEGHVRRKGLVGTNGIEKSTPIQIDEDAEDTEGHRYARGYFYEDGEDTEGHVHRR